jgi:glycosyltransferase involved in cell wall biosynthesis
MGKNDNPMTICFFSHLSQLGGAEQSLLELVKEFIHDYRITCLVILPEDGPLKKKLEDSGALTCIIDYSWWCESYILSPEATASVLARSYCNILKNISFIKSINPDFIFTNTMLIPWGAIVSSLTGKPHVWFIHEFGKFSNQPDHDFHFFIPFKKVLPLIINSSNAILTNSHAVKNELFREDGDKVYSVYYHIEIPLQNTPLNSSKKYFLHQHSLKILLSGYIRESKGQQDAVLAVRELVASKYNVELLLVGYSDPSYKFSLNEIIKRNNLTPYIKFMDFTENVFPAIVQSDIALQCSRNEAFGRVTLEAMLLGKPVIGADSGGTPELIKEGFNGFLYKPGDHIQLSRKIEYFIHNRDKIALYGENGRAFAVNTFTKINYGGKIYAILQSLKGQTSPPVSDCEQQILKLILGSAII